ncbi:MAG: hypothetical protein P0Y64_00520 [Candidatus Sphingomonas colombiensis]|nr:hypothetical protein [Sphingomonas sp.]WEK45121.1 MAG: hypothetical protein P0Y64_00520 [Sphingomonas sp.]
MTASASHRHNSNLLVLRRPVESAQYAFGIYRALLAAHDMVGSMSRRGNPYENAKAESFIKTLKFEEQYTRLIVISAA